MSDPLRIPGDLVVPGNITCNSINLPFNTVGDDQVNSGSPLQPTKVVQQVNVLHRVTSGSVVTTLTSPLYGAWGAGTVTGLRAKVLVANSGAATIGIVVKKNGTSILSATFQLVAGSGTGWVNAGLDVAQVTYAAGDTFTIEVTATAGGGTVGQGLVVQMIAKEASS